MTIASGSKRGLDSDPFVGGGAMAGLMRSVDWAATPLGPVDAWPQSLRTALSILNASGYPMYIAWGPEFVQFYNDAYRPILGATKHPAAMGQSTRVCFAEIWDFIGPMFERVMREGEQTYLEDQLLELERYGFSEECYFTFSYSAIRDETGGVGGVFVTVIETTERVLGERRLRMLRELAAAGSGAESATEAAAREAAILAREPRDIPFSLVYLLDDAGDTLRPIGSTGIAPGSRLAPVATRADHATGAPWPLWEVIEAGRASVVGDLEIGSIDGHPWPEPVTHAVVMPIARPGQERPAGVLVAGLSPRLAFDDRYRDFLDLVSGHVGTAIADARAYEEERRRAESLAELDRAKTAFFSDVSHEFRTPLTLVLGPLEEALAEPDRLDPALAHELGVARRNSLRLLKLVNTLLDFSRIEAGRVEAVYEPTDLAELTADLASVFRSAVERAGLDLVVDCPPLGEPVPVDRDMWEKIVLNLLSNALKFTFEGRITVRLARDGEDVVLRVEDTGTGIEPAEVGRIFERFHRIRGARSRTHEGTGIGLALVQELVRLHEGTITVDSQPGAGTTFTVRVPRQRRIHAGQAARRSVVPTSLAMTYTEEALRWLPGAGADGRGTDGAGPVDAGIGTDEPEPLVTGGATAAHARILLADDNADMREYVERLLGRHWRIDSVADGRAAFEAAVADPPDLVLADVMMPGLDGFELLDALRADAATRDVPVVLLSARAGEEARIEGLERGADDYLTKPYSARELVARVAAHLQLAAHRRDAAAGERERASRARRLAEAALAANAASTLDELLEIATEAARSTLGAKAAGALLAVDDPSARVLSARSVETVPPRGRRRSRAAGDRTAPAAPAAGARKAADVLAEPVRLSRAELTRSRRWAPAARAALGDAALRGLVATPIVGRDGESLGFIAATDRRTGDFTTEDESLIAQLAQVVSLALERIQVDERRVQRERQQAAVAQIGQQALGGASIQDLLQEASRIVYETLDVDFVKVLELLPTGEELRVVAGSGWPDGVVGAAKVPNDLGSQAGYTLGVDEPVIVEDLASETRFRGPALLLNHGVVSGLSVIIAGEARPFGVLGAHTTSRRRFTDHDVAFVRSVANVVAAALERHAAEERLAAFALAERVRASELRAVLEAMDEGIVVVDSSGGVLLRNAAADALLGVAVVRLDDLLGAFEWSDSDRPLADAAEAAIERRLRHLDDRWGELRAYPVPDSAMAAASTGTLGTILVVRDVTEERRARGLRDAFIGVLSHELRTPITTIFAGAKLLARHAAPDAGGRAPAHSQADLIGDIEAEADRLYRLVEDLLVLARFERGATEILGEPVLLQRILPRVVRSESARWPSARIEVSIAPDLPSVRADPTYAEQIARNLLGNAVKYSEPGSPIRLTAEPSDHEVVVRVEDEGPGIVPEEADRLFDLFYRSPTVTRKPGAGIGLFVARGLAETMGGRMWAQPRSPRGSEFGFALRFHGEE